jgi:beta-galactosidase GanA
MIMECATVEALRRYDCIILPTSPCLADDAVARLKEYVSGGGNLVACLDVGFFDGDGQPREAGPLSDLIGVRFEKGLHKFQAFDYIAVEDRRTEWFRGVAADLIPTALHGLKVTAQSARVLARFHEPLPGRYVPLTPKSGPAVTINTFGKGRVLYFAGSVGEFYNEYTVAEYRSILVNAIEAFAKLPVAVTGGPESLEVTHRAKRDGSADIVHLVNYTGGMNRPIVESVALRGVRLLCRGLAPVKQATALRAVQSLKVSVTKSGVQRIALPALREYEVVVLTH